MEYAKLGNTDLIVSRFCVGCMGFGDSSQGQHTWTLNQIQTKDIIKKALNEGLNFFDTAIGYSNGTSEQYLGKAIKELTSRDKVILATKFLPRNEEEINKGVTAKEHINQSIEQSLKNLGTDYIDLYIYHMWDYNTPAEEVMEALNQIVKDGKARAIGISNCFAWQLAETNALALKNGWVQFNCVQGHYNLIHREEEREMIPYCRMKNIALTPYSSLAGGRLSRLPGEESTKRSVEDTYAASKYDATAEQDNIIINRVAEIAKKYDTSMTAISLAWLLSKVTSPVVGVTKEKHLEGIKQAIELELAPDDLYYLEEAYVPHKLVGVMADNNPYYK